MKGSVRVVGRTEGSALGLSERKSGQERSRLPQRGLCLASVSLASTTQRTCLGPHW